MKAWLPLASILAITFLATVALLKGINGTLLAGAFALLSGLGGFTLAKSSPSHLLKVILSHLKRHK